MAGQSGLRFRLPRKSQGSFTCRKSATWDRRLYFPSEGRHAVDFFARKIRRLRPGFNPRSWIPEASMLTTRPPKPLSNSVYSNTLRSPKPHTTSINSNLNEARYIWNMLCVVARVSCRTNYSWMRYFTTLWIAGSDVFEGRYTYTGRQTRNVTTQNAYFWASNDIKIPAKKLSQYYCWIPTESNSPKHFH
jgi:hypothetical protein